MKLVIPTVLMLGAAVIVACSSGSDADSGSPKCTISRGDQLFYCYEFGSGYTVSHTSALCDVNQAGSGGKRVSSCPTNDIIGTCSVSGTEGGIAYHYDWKFYGSSGMTCDAAKRVCEANTLGATTNTFAGDGC